MMSSSPSSPELPDLPSALANDGVRGALAAALRAMPWLPSHRSVSRKLNRAWLARGAEPLVQAPMDLGHRLWVDLRTSSQFHAYYTGRYDSPFLTRLIRLIEPHSCMLDVGANVGFYTVPLARAARRVQATLHAFEPLPANCDRLQKNLELNQIERDLTLWRFGLSNEPRTARLTLREDFGTGADTGNAAIVIGAEADRNFAQVDIELRTLDGFCEQQGVTRLDLIKADIEGHEDLLLEGGQRSLRRWRPVLFLEVNKQYYTWRGMSLAERLAALLPENYLTFKSADGKGERWQEIPNVDVCERLDNVFIVPKERASQVLQQLG
jgi:FkbM family methyltransferase